MKKFIVDACIAVKWFIPERHSQAALKLLGYDFVLMAPDYLLAEVSNVLWKKIRFNEISLEEGQNTLAAIQNSPIRFINFKSLLHSTFHFS